MSKDKNSSAAPCIIGEGTIYQKKDMLRALETIDGVVYNYRVDGRVVSEGEGNIMKVFASKTAATLVINNCLFLNVFSFNYLNFRTLESGQTEIELIDESRLLRLIATNEELPPARIEKQAMREVDQYDDDETFALLEDIDDDDD